MHALLYSLTVAIVVVAIPLKAQTLSDLQRLSDTVFDLSITSPLDDGAFEQIVERRFPTARFGEAPLSSLIGSHLEAQGIARPAPRMEPPLPAEWDGRAEYRKANFPDYSYLDGITCVTMTKEGARYLQALNDADDYEARARLPPHVRQFYLSLFEDAFLNGAIMAQTCIAAIHPKPDRLDLDAWDAWYNGLEVQLEGLGFEVERSPASPPAYLAGFLSGKGTVCEVNACMIAAAPFNVALPDLNTNQATFSVGSVLYP